MLSTRKLLAIAMGGLLLLGLPYWMRPRGPEYCCNCRWPVNPTHPRAGPEEGLLSFFGLGGSRPCERRSSSLRELVSAQADFRANDRDGNGVQDFWRGDVSGLYRILDRNGTPIKLTPYSQALADARPLDFPGGSLGPARPLGGFLYRAIPHEGEKTPDPNRFAFVAYPAEYPHHARWTYIIDENNTIVRRDLGHGLGLDAFPADLGGWVKMD
jgi:hypothetical protein